MQVQAEEQGHIAARAQVRIMKLICVWKSHVCVGELGFRLHLVELGLCLKLGVGWIIFRIYEMNTLFDCLELGLYLKFDETAVFEI